MKKKFVLSRKQMPSNIPLFHTALLFLILERFNASPLVWGIVGTLWAIILLACIYAVIRQETMEIEEIKLRQKISDVSDKQNKS